MRNDRSERSHASESPSVSARDGGLPGERLAAALKRVLSGTLPGFPAQERMAPAVRRFQSFEGREWRPAAVLVLLHPGAAGLRFPLTVRRDTLPHHAGQVSLPGGSLEPGETPLDAALRETNEELGVELSGLEVLGRLTALKIPPSGFEIVPFVAFLKETPRFEPEEGEVAEVLEMELLDLLDAEAAGVEERDFAGSSYPVPFWRLGSHKVWGATAMVLAELAELLWSALAETEADIDGGPDAF